MLVTGSYLKAAWTVNNFPRVLEIQFSVVEILFSWTSALNYMKCSKSQSRLIEDVKNNVFIVYLRAE